MIGLIDEEVADDLVKNMFDRVVAIKAHLKMGSRENGKRDGESRYSELLNFALKTIAYGNM